MRPLQLLSRVRFSAQSPLLQLVWTWIIVVIHVVWLCGTNDSVTIKTHVSFISSGSLQQAASRCSCLLHDDDWTIVMTNCFLWIIICFLLIIFTPRDLQLWVSWYRSIIQHHIMAQWILCYYVHCCCVYWLKPQTKADSSDCDNMSTPPKSLLNELISDFKFIYDQQVWRSVWKQRVWQFGVEHSDVRGKLSRSGRPSRFRVQCSETWKDIDLDLWLRDHDKCSWQYT